MLEALQVRVGQRRVRSALRSLGGPAQWLDLLVQLQHVPLVVQTCTLHIDAY